MGAVANAFLHLMAAAILLAVGYNFPNALADTLSWLDATIASSADGAEPTGTLKLILQFAGAGFVVLMTSFVIALGFTMRQFVSQTIFRWRRIMIAGLIPLLAHMVKWSLGLWWPALLVPFHTLVEVVYNWFSAETQIQLDLFNAKGHLMTIIIGLALVMLWSLVTFIWRRFRGRKAAAPSPTPQPPAPSGNSKWSRFMSAIKSFVRRLGLFSNSLIAALVWVIWNYSPADLFWPITFTVFAVLFGFFLAALGFILQKDRLTFKAFDAARGLKKVSLFIQVDKGRASVIEMGGRPIRVIQGGEIPSFTLAFVGMWWAYQLIVYKTIGLYVFIPFFTNPKIYPLPRYKAEEGEGHKVYRAIKDTDPNFWSDHVRTAITTWILHFKGVDVQKVSFTVDGSIQYHIDPDKVEESLYLTDAWNVLLDQVSNTLIRGILRKEMTLDELLGSLPKELWQSHEVPDTDTLGEKLSVAVKTALDDYNFTYKGKVYYLKDLGIIILKVDFTDFKDELTEAQRAQLLAGVFGREKGRGISLEGQGVAEGQQKQLAAVEGAGKLGPEVIRADALVRAAGAGSLDALVGAFIQKQQKS
jgi:hypothetical protein